MKEFPKTLLNLSFNFRLWSDEALKQLISKEYKHCSDESFSCLKNIRDMWKQNKNLVKIFSVGNGKSIELSILRGFVNCKCTNKMDSKNFIQNKQPFTFI